MENEQPPKKKIKISNASPFRGLSIMPDHVIEAIISYIGINAGDENPSDEDRTWKKPSYVEDNVKQKFLLGTVWSRFQKALDNKGSWKFNNCLKIYPKSGLMNLDKPSQVRINSILFCAEKAPAALEILLEKIRVEKIIVVHLTSWAIHDWNKPLIVAMLEVISNEKFCLSQTVRKLILHGYLSHVDSKDFVMWLYNCLPKLRCLDMTFPASATHGKTFDTDFLETQIANYPLEYVTLSEFEHFDEVVNLLGGKELKEITLQNSKRVMLKTEDLTALVNSNVDGKLQSFVIRKCYPNPIVKLGQFFDNVRLESLSNLKNFVLDGVHLYDISNLVTSLKKVPESVQYLKLHNVYSVFGNKRKIFTLVSKIISCFFDEMSVCNADIEFRSEVVIYSDDFVKIGKTQDDQWKDISIEQEREQVGDTGFVSYCFSRLQKRIKITILYYNPMNY